MERTEPMYVDSGNLSMDRSVPSKDSRAQSCSSSPIKRDNKLFPSIKGDGSNTPCMDKVLSQFLPISKRMLILLRPSPHLWDLLGRIDETFSVDFAIRLPSGPSTNFKSVRCLGGKSPTPSTIRRNLGTREAWHVWSHPRHTANSLTSPGSQSCSSGELTQETPQVSSSKKSRR